MRLVEIGHKMNLRPSMTLCDSPLIPVVTAGFWLALMPQSHFHRSPKRLVCDALTRLKVGAFGGWLARCRRIICNHRWNTRGQRGPGRHFKREWLGVIFYRWPVMNPASMRDLSKTYERRTSALPGILRHMWVISRFVQVRRLEDDWMVTGE